MYSIFTILLVISERSAEYNRLVYCTITNII